VGAKQKEEQNGGGVGKLNARKSARVTCEKHAKRKESSCIFLLKEKARMLVRYPKILGNKKKKMKESSVGSVFYSPEFGVPGTAKLLRKHYKCKRTAKKRSVKKDNVGRKNGAKQ